jgi:demethylmenaquinone methyltransferase / 2-methoxy-6-polyprenyl-1,4-benzoquinol methylase
VTAEPGRLGRDKQPDRIAGMFDAIAPRYDLLNHLLSGGLDLHWRTKAVRSLALRGGESVLDLCTGTADLAIATATATPGAESVVGVDFAGRMLQLGRGKIAQQGLASRIRLVQGDATRIPLAAGSADAATVAFGIRNVERPEAAFAEVFRVLRPGGRFAILEFGVPRLPGVRQAYLAYFRHVLPRVGSIISGHASAYAYLPASVGSFPEPEQVVASLAATGFSRVRADSLSLGIVYLYSAVKPERR